MFPYVSDEVKYTTFYDEQDFNNGTSAHIASYFRGYQSVGGSDREYWNALTYGQGSASDVVNLNYFVNNAGTVSGDDIAYVFNQIPNNMQTDAYYETQEYVDKYNDVISKIMWVWGSYEDGGLFCYKDSVSGEIVFYLENGFFSKEFNVPGEEEPVYKKGFSMSFGGGYDTSIYDFSKVQFRYNAYEKQNGSIFMKYITMCVPQKAYIDNVQFAIITNTPYGYTLTGMHYDYSELADMEPDWFETELVSDPMQIFNADLCNESRRDLFYAFDFTGYIHLKGMPDGNMSSESDPNSGANIGSADPSGASLDNDVDTDDPGDADIDNNPYDVVNTDLVLLYNPSTSELADFNEFLFSGITDSMYNVFKKLQSDPMQFIVSLGLVHFTPPVSTRGAICFGGYDTGVTCNRINKQMKSFNFGSINIKREFNNFLDYPVYSKLKIFLPYIGYRELNMDECRGSILTLIYNIDMLTGACVANLHIQRSSRWNKVDTLIDHNVYSFNGNCMLQVPMSATDNRGTIQALGQLIGGIGSMATGNVAGGISGIVGGITQEKITSERASTVGSNFGYMSMQKPFILAERPIVSMPTGFGSFEGWKAPIKMKLSNLVGKGYTEIDANTIWTDNIMCSEEEAEEIRQLFNNGVYL